MQNNKQAEVMAPDQNFEVLQTADGDSLFFSIGTDSVFYLTQEVEGTNSGWTKIDLSSALSQQQGGAQVVAKLFDVSQNVVTGAIDLALAITVAGSDFLYLSQGNPNTSAAFGSGVTWTAIPFDDSANPVSPLVIADVYVLQSPNGEYCVVDILKQPGNALNLISRYYISPAAAQKWNPHSLAVDLSAGSISSCLGQRTGDYVAGIYTFGSITGETQLVFTPLWNVWNQSEAPTPAGFTVPSGATTIAAALNSQGVSNLFVAAADALYVFTPASQKTGATAVCIASNAIVDGVLDLHASTGPTSTAVWGLNQSGDLFYLQCPVGSEGTASAWSNPVPILTGVEQIASFLNSQVGNSVIFAHTEGQDLVQLTQDPVTSVWQQRSILLPSTDLDDLITYNSFTTQITVTDDYNLPAGNTGVSLTSTSPVSVYVNDIYQVLSPSVPFQTATDATGVLTIVQETDSLGAVCFHVQLPATGESADVNPMSNLLATLGTIQSGDDLANLTVTNSDGSTQPLLPSSVTSDQRDATAQSIQQFVAIAATLPPDGTNNSGTLSAPPQSFNVNFADGGWTCQQGGAPPVSSPAGLTAPRLMGFAGDIGSAIEVAAGDFFSWAKTAYDDISGFFIQAAGAAYDFYIQIGEDVYHVVLDCVRTVAHAVELVFNKIGIFLDDLIKWLGFLFEWNDILRTHTVIKNVFKQYAAYSIAGIGSAEKAVTKFFTDLEKNVNNWAGIPGTTTTIGSYQTSATSAPGQNSPQCGWALHHTKSNLPSASTSYTSPSPDLTPFATIFQSLETLVTNEASDFRSAVTTVQSDIVNARATLTPGQAAQKLVDALLNVLLSSAENFLTTAMTILEQLAAGLDAMLDAPIDIPVLSKIYKDLTGDDMSALDLVCLIAAIPTTIIYKLLQGETPFPEGDTTTALTNASDFATLQQLLNPPPTSSAMTAAAAGPVAATPLRIVGLALSITAAWASVGIVVVNSIKRLVGPGFTPLNVFAASIYLPYIAPDIAEAIDTHYKAWYTIMNDVVTGVSVVKTFVDAITPLALLPVWSNIISTGLESAINITWLAPAIGYIIMNADNLEPSDWLGYVSNVFFDVGGAFTPATIKENWAYLGSPLMEATAQGFFESTCVASLMYGAFSLGAGIAQFTKH